MAGGKGACSGLKRAQTLIEAAQNSEGWKPVRLQDLRYGFL